MSIPPPITCNLAPLPGESGQQCLARIARAVHPAGSSSAAPVPVHQPMGVETVGAAELAELRAGVAKKRTDALALLRAPKGKAKR